MNPGRLVDWRGGFRHDCRGVRGLLPDLIRARMRSDSEMDDGAWGAVERHLAECPTCFEEHRLITLELMVLEASRLPILPEETFFAAVRARIAREAEGVSRSDPDEYWSGLVWMTARQMIPVMATLLLLIFGASLMWGNQSGGPLQQKSSARPSDRVLFNEVYEYPQPTSDDVLEAVLTVEEKKNGK